VYNYIRKVIIIIIIIIIIIDNNNKLISLCLQGLHRWRVVVLTVVTAALPGADTDDHANSGELTPDCEHVETARTPGPPSDVVPSQWRPGVATPLTSRTPKVTNIFGTN